MLEIRHNSRPGNGHGTHGLQIRYRDAVTVLGTARSKTHRPPVWGPLQLPCAFLCPLSQDTLMGLTRKKKMMLAPDPQAADCPLVACSRKALAMCVCKAMGRREVTLLCVSCSPSKSLKS